MQDNKKNRNTVKAPKSARNTLLKGKKLSMELKDTFDAVCKSPPLTSPTKKVIRTRSLSFKSLDETKNLRTSTVAAPKDRYFYFIRYTVCRGKNNWKGPYIWMELNNILLFNDEESAKKHEITTNSAATYTFHYCGIKVEKYSNKIVSMAQQPSGSDPGIVNRLIKENDKKLTAAVEKIISN